MERYSTKEKILYAAIMLFSDTGYDKVSMRDIASKVGIKAASIYNHFSSKRDILKSIYDFYEHQQSLVKPDLNEMLKMLETEPLEKVFMGMNFQYPKEIEEYMNRAIMIASRGLYGDEDAMSERFIRTYLFDMNINTIVPLLNRVIELGKIEPIDVDRFSCVLTYYAFSAAMLNHSSMKINLEQWKSGVSMVFSLLRAR